MLSYQHAYHAGNLADVQKHALLAYALDYLGQKEKPFTYIETHAGRGLYDLGSAESAQTGEAAMGVLRLAPHLPPGHPYAKVLALAAARFGPSAYPGSPLIAALLRRPGDKIHLAERHRGEFAALAAALAPFPLIKPHFGEGIAWAQSLCPPFPRRGLLLIDPSYEVKDEYQQMPKVLSQLHRKWNVGVLMLWYPLLTSGLHEPMGAALTAAFPAGLRIEWAFPPARPGHRMVGSGLFVVNPPFGLQAAAESLHQSLAPHWGAP